MDKPWRKWKFCVKSPRIPRRWICKLQPTPQMPNIDGVYLKIKRWPVSCLRQSLWLLPDKHCSVWRCKIQMPLLPEQLFCRFGCVFVFADEIEDLIQWTLSVQVEIKAIATWFVFLMWWPQFTSFRNAFRLNALAIAKCVLRYIFDHWMNPVYSVRRLYFLLKFVEPNLCHCPCVQIQKLIYNLNVYICWFCLLALPSWANVPCHCGMQSAGHCSHHYWPSACGVACTICLRLVYACKMSFKFNVRFASRRTVHKQIKWFVAIIIIIDFITETPSPPNKQFPFAKQWQKLDCYRAHYIWWFRRRFDKFIPERVIMERVCRWMCVYNGDSSMCLVRKLRPQTIDTAVTTNGDKMYEIGLNDIHTFRVICERFIFLMSMG